MHVFTIDADNNITVHPNRKIARQTGAGVFDTAESFAELIGGDNKRMIEIWNGLTGVTPVRKFTSGAVAARRIFAVVQKIASPAGATAAGLDGMAPAPMRSPKPSAPAGPTASKKATGRSAKKAIPEATGSKKEILLRLISRENGASLDQLTAALGWQKHSVRGFIATLGRKVSIESFKTEQGVRTYKTS